MTARLPFKVNRGREPSLFSHFRQCIMTPSNTKILVIDDEEANVRVLSISLRSDGFEVVTAYSGEQGLEVFKKESPDLVLTDIDAAILDDGVASIAANLDRQIRRETVPWPSPAWRKARAGSCRRCRR